MAVERTSQEEGATKARKPAAQNEPKRRMERPRGEVSRILALQRLVGNRAVQRLLAQRDGDGEGDGLPAFADTRMEEASFLATGGGWLTDAEGEQITLRDAGLNGVLIRASGGPGGD